MTEGELYGQVPAEKIAHLAIKIENRNAFYYHLTKLKEALKKENIDESLQESLFGKLEKELEKIDREIILAGAPIKLAAEGENVILFGSENKGTLSESKILVEDFIYLQDRMDELGKVAERNENNLRLFSGETEMLLKFLSEKSLDKEFNALQSKSQLQGKDDLANLLRETKTAYDKLASFKGDNLVQTNGVERENNPYQGIKNRRVLQDKLEEAEGELQKVVVERRNKETAENFSQILKQNGKNIGILQFGAGHEEGLVQELKNQGLLVFVISPLEVSSRN